MSYLLSLVVNCAASHAHAFNTQPYADVVGDDDSRVYPDRQPRKQDPFVRQPNNSNDVCVCLSRKSVALCAQGWAPAASFNGNAPKKQK